MSKSVFKNLRMKISKTMSIKYWKHLRLKIDADFDNKELWEEAYQLFEERLNHRYLMPIRLIEQYDNFSGQGFSIMTIYCSLIEFLETTIQGINFNIDKKKLQGYEYGLGYSKEIFTSFLTKRKPFLIDKAVAIEFYKSVRCGLLHEAKLGKGWKIRVDNSKVINLKDEKYTVNRKIFSKRINQFLTLYKKNLLQEPQKKKAFIRKFDYLTGS